MNEEKQENVESQVEEKKVEETAAAAPEAQAPVKKKTSTPAASSKKEDKAASKKASKEEKKDAATGDEAPEIIEKVIAINRITKVTKGGKNLSFSVLVVVGDTKGRVGYSMSKAKEVATAIRKSMANAKKNLVPISLKGTTIPHEIIGRCSGSRVLLKPASEGTGVIASGPVRAVCDGAGIHNILTKVHGSNNPMNVVKATMDGLNRLKTAKVVTEQPKEVE